MRGKGGAGVPSLRVEEFQGGFFALSVAFCSSGRSEAGAVNAGEGSALDLEEGEGNCRLIWDLCRLSEGDNVEREGGNNDIRLRKVGAGSDAGARIVLPFVVFFGGVCSVRLEPAFPVSFAAN
jgi:hypothetical protein